MGTQSEQRTMEGIDNKNNSGGMKISSGAKYCEMILRFLAMVTTLVAAVVVGIDKQTKVVPITLMAGIPPMNIPVYAKWHYLSAFVYHVVANSIACAYAAISLILFSKISKKRGTATMMIAVLDLITVALLFSSIGAAGAVGILGSEGNSHVRWNKVCNVFGRFCHHLAAGLGLSLVGAIAFVLLTALDLSNLKKSANWA